MIKLFKDFYSYFRPYRLWFWTGFILMILVNLITNLIPLGIRHIWDRVFPLINQPDGFWVLGKWCGLLIAAAFIRAVFIFCFIYCYWTTGAKVVNDLRNILYDKLQRLSFRYYDSARTGDIMSRLTLDIEMIRNFYAYLIEHRMMISLYLPIVTGLLFITDWKLALLTMAFAPVLIMTVLNFSLKTRQAVDERQEQAGILSSTVQENIVGIRVVKAFGMEKTEVTKFNLENQKMMKKNINVSKLQVALLPILLLGSSLGMVAILWYGGYRIILGDLTLGTFMAFMAYISVLAWPLWILAPNTNQMRQAQGSAKRLLELLNEPEEITSPPDGGKKIPVLKGEIRFSNVSFGYQDSSIVNGVNLMIKPGEKVALLGLTGSGKTTLMNLIPRFYDPQIGEITIDGIDLKNLNLNWWRKQVGLVLQETFLFSASIKDNIAFARPEANIKEIEAAAGKAQIHDFITSLPQGYATIVGERGVGLSGGQRQRIAIARALLVNPKILILDDFTSSVDAETEKAIQDSLQYLLENRTSILITQRLSTAQLADRIIILESGSIRAEGNHAQLLENDSFYQQLYQLQFYHMNNPGETA